MTQPSIYALIVAAGTGSRAGGALPKQYHALGGRAMLRHSVEALLHHHAIAGVQVVIHPEHYDLYAQSLLETHLPPGGGGRRAASGEGEIVVGSHPLPNPLPSRERGHSAGLLPPVYGGSQRSDSVRAGLNALAPHQPDYVLIHDAARPFLSTQTLDAIIAKLSPHHAVVPTLAVADTLRRHVAGGWEEIPRAGVMRIQTPQAFPFEALKKIYASGAATDDAALWLAAGFALDYVHGSEELRKVTTAEDMVWAEKKFTASTRSVVGMGYDVHALVPSGEEGVIRLGGVEIASAHKLHGHSDADVVLHAIVDALLGTVAEGDIGSHFPPTDARWKGANSRVFMEEARARVAAHGGVISHVDVTIIAERPKVAPHRDAMRAAIAEMLHVPLARVSVKATTTEKLGFTGREEGIACQAVATVSLPEM